MSTARNSTSSLSSAAAAMVWLSDKTTSGLDGKVKDLSEADGSLKIPCLMPSKDAGDPCFLPQPLIKPSASAKSGLLLEPEFAGAPAISLLWITSPGRVTVPARTLLLTETGNVYPLDLGPAGGLDLIIEDDGDAKHWILEGVKANGNLMFTAINLNYKPMNLYERCLSDIMEATNIRISGKKAVVIGYGDAAHKGCAISLKHAGAYVVVYEVDGNHASQALLGGFAVTTTLDDVVSVADVFAIVTTGIINKGNIIIANYTKKMKNDAVIFNMDASNIFPEAAIYPLAEHLKEKVSALHLAKLATTTNKVTNGKDGHVSLPIGELGSGFNTSTDEPKKIDMKRILRKAVKACSVFGIFALGLTVAFKVKMELSLCAIWGN